MRDDFSESTKRTIAARVASRCSNPQCRAQVSGPQLTSDSALNLGVAAHITAASAGGPRFDPALGSSGRSAASNGVWLCQNCAKLVDNDPQRYSVNILREWKEDAERDALSTIGKPAPSMMSSTEPGVKWCTLNYVEDAGIGAALREDGYRLHWVRADRLAEAVDIKEWEEVVWDDPNRGPVYLRVKDPSCDYLALVKKREST